MLSPSHLADVLANMVYVNFFKTPPKKTLWKGKKKICWESVGVINIIFKSAKETSYFWSGIENKNKIRAIAVITSYIVVYKEFWGFPGDSVVKNLPGNEGVMDSIPGSGRSSGEENGNALQYSCLEIPMDRGAWRVIVHGITKESDMT